MTTSALNLRIDQKTKEALEELARKYRMQDGEPWSVSDVVRAAIAEKLEREKLTSK